LVTNRDELIGMLHQHEIYPGVHYRDNTEYRMYAHASGSCPKPVRQVRSCSRCPCIWASPMPTSSRLPRRSGSTRSRRRPLEKPLFQIEGDGFDLIPLREHHLPTTMAWRNADSVRIWFKTPDVVSAEQHLEWLLDLLEETG